jgi:hypothetical protein
MKIKTSELIDLALDWAVATCESRPHSFTLLDSEPPLRVLVFQPSTDWSQGGPIIEREGIAMWPDEEGGFLASADEGKGKDYHGPTPLIAAMRAYVASKLGDDSKGLSHDL